MAATPAEIVTRIAPSPTGFMHIGTARTALFNWAYSKGRGGRFLLRIEDTDRARNSREAVEAILDGLRWLGLDWDGDAVSQFERAPRHAEVARRMLATGAAYRCHATQDEIAAFREAAKAKGESTLFRSPWRDVPEDDKPEGGAIRLKAPRDGVTVIRDAVQGEVTIRNDTLDDMVLLRADGTPTYMLAVVVDDHDMGVTHVIRGDDHLTNAARQMQVYAAMGWPIPEYAHIPLIHGPDGKKLSKRHGALGVAEYRAMGFPASAMRNYLARLGWSHGDDEVFGDDELIGWFDLDGVKASPARLDLAKLEAISGRHIAMADDAALLHGIADFLDATGAEPLTEGQADRLLAAMPHLKERAKTYPELLEKGHFALASRPVNPDGKAAKALDADARAMLGELTPRLREGSWTRDDLEGIATAFAEAQGTKFGKLAGPLRAALAGRTVTPSVFDMMLVLGRDETLARLTDAAEG
ncbi:MAG: glutamate--tRNA ligase [Hasllibacter sp.]